MHGRHLRRAFVTSECINGDITKRISSTVSIRSEAISAALWKCSEMSQEFTDLSSNTLSVPGTIGVSYLHGIFLRLGTI